ncbi:MAG: gluconokinase [Opitutales bacterium]
MPFDSSRKSGLVVLCGPCGCGKTTVGEAVAAAWDAPFLEGDAYHPAENREKMRRGTPLTDADRAPWLEALRTAAEAHLNDGRGTVVMACSALKRSYRARLTPVDYPARFFLLWAEEAELLRRVGSRSGHYMPIDLVTSQVATLERGPDLIELDATQPVDHLVMAIIGRLTRISHEAQM